MVNNKNALKDFIDDIPASKLTGLPKIRYNLQIQFSKETTIPTYKKVALRSWAKAEPPVGEWNAEEVRRELVKGIVVFR
ncbi:hypothetical protein ABVK25_008166 [Lepraria finkii]|uniref:Uncharacterized protein n=1 Tax=Lepraria finkii TaxID=1340010 RepID=A0ABR4B0Y8_9LECA